MRSAYRRSVCLLLAMIFVLSSVSDSSAKPGFMRKRSAESYTREINFGSNTSRDSMIVDTSGKFEPVKKRSADYSTREINAGSKTSRSASTRKEQERALRWLQKEIVTRLGIPYKTAGVDERGFDCSGFVWRVFHESGVDFERSSTRRLWEILPEATLREQSQFGTVVFFRGLNHVGIVRDENTFYHVSSSQGVTVSEFSGYWEERLVGFRSALSLFGARREEDLNIARADKKEQEKMQREDDRSSARADKKEQEKTRREDDFSAPRISKKEQEKMRREEDRYTARAGKKEHEQDRDLRPSSIYLPSQKCRRREKI